MNLESVWPDINWPPAGHMNLESVWPQINWPPDDPWRDEISPEANRHFYWLTRNDPFQSITELGKEAIRELVFPSSVWWR